MKPYRLYFLNNQGRIRHAIEFECAGDQEAVAALDAHRDGRAMELWNLDRRVGAFEAAHDEGAV